jgi:CheY-like chemotaxis protein
MLDNLNQDIARDLSLLCGQFDHLLSAPEAELSTEAETELRAMAKIYDLDAAAPPAQIWTRLRGVLVKQMPPAIEPETQGEPLTLLLVEDDEEAASSLTEALDAAGHRVVGPFHSGEAAEAAAALHGLDAALLDINLSGETTGVDLARSLKSRWGTPVIFLSGDVTAAAQNEDVADAIITKPYSGRDILSALKRLQVA